MLEEQVAWRNGDHGGGRLQRMGQCTCGYACARGCWGLRARWRDAGGMLDGRMLAAMTEHAQPCDGPAATRQTLP
jgi:hypothetical protein